jgi:hypothetical protein
MWSDYQSPVQRTFHMMTCCEGAVIKEGPQKIMHISLPEFDDTTIFEFWKEIMAPPQPVGIVSLSTPRPTFFGCWTHPSPLQYKFCNILTTLTDWKSSWTQHKHPTPLLARTSGFSLCLCKFVLRCRTYHKYWTMDFVRLYWHIIKYFTHRQILFWPRVMGGASNYVHYTRRRGWGTVQSRGGYPGIISRTKGSWHACHPTTVANPGRGACNMYGGGVPVTHP